MVIGLGALGAATLARLARGGIDALGIDAHPPPHVHGATHGDTRLIRRAYFEDARYIPLLVRAEEGWRDLEARRGASFYHRVGLVVGGEGTGKLAAMLRNGADHGVPLERLDAGACRERFPRLAFPGEGGAVLEPGAGYLRVEAAQEAVLADARAHGATTLAPARVTGWRREGAGFLVELGEDAVACARLFVAAGAWTARLVPDLPFPLRLWRAPQVWFLTPPGHTREDGLPCFAFDLAAGFFYGFPATDRRGVKVAAYDPALALEDPDGLADLEPAVRELDPLREVVANHLPDLPGEIEAREMCVYACSPDEDFLLGEHPGTPGLQLLAADSGHAFKFAPALADAVFEEAYGAGLPADCAFLGWR